MKTAGVFCWVLSTLCLQVAAAANGETFTFLEEASHPDKRAETQWTLTFSNPLNSYRIRLKNRSPNGSSPPHCAIDCYNTDKCGFGVLVEWLVLRVNGIVYNRLAFRKEDIAPYSVPGRRGFDVALNFDGAHVVLRLYMREDSPCLWGELIPKARGSDRVREAELAITGIPSYLDPKGKQPGVARFGGYKRRIVTAARTLDGTEKHRKTPVTAADGWFLFEDTEYDGTSEIKGKGPCFATFDFSGVGMAEANVSDGWLVNVTATLKPGAESLRFGIWESPGKRVSNAETEACIRLQRDAFGFGKGAQ